MRDLFPGYFTPTKEDFDQLWREGTFAFDANVLLDLYRLTSGARQVFFDVLQRLKDRIFLPNRAAHEYLRKRLAAVSARLTWHEAVKSEAARFAQNFETRMQERALPESQDILQTVQHATTKIIEIINAAIKREPDLLRSDDVLSQLTNLFLGKTGPPYDVPKFDALCKRAAARYLSKTPPGYKDDSKAEPDKYGDALIWFQLLDFATSTKKSLVFVTRDLKEDWWLQHNGGIIGPRPELVQEMKQLADVNFYMYTTPRFLEFAQAFFKLTPEPTKKATSEIEEIEKQDKYVADQPAWVWVNEPLQYGPPIHNTGYTQPLQWTSDMAGPFTAPPVFNSQEEETKSRYFQLLPVNGQIFNSSTGKWKCEIDGTPQLAEIDRLTFRLRFQHEDRSRETRRLNLWVSNLGLRNDSDWKYKNAIARVIVEWLDGGNISGEIKYAL